MYKDLQDVDTIKLLALGWRASCLTPLLRPLHVHCTFAKRSTWNWCLLSYMHNYFLSHLLDLWQIQSPSRPMHPHTNTRLLSIANANLAFSPQSSYQPTCETKCNYIDIPRVLPNCMGDTACLLIVHDRFCAIVLSLSSLIFQCIIMCICIFFRIRTFNAMRN